MKTSVQYKLLYGLFKAIGVNKMFDKEGPDFDKLLKSCRKKQENAVSEMEQIDLFYEDLMKDYSPEKLKVWNVLRSQMPSWEELHKKYGN